MPADRAMGSIAAGGDRAVAVGSAGQVFAITGDNSRITVEVSERSHAAAIDAAQVYRRVALEHFTGREWLVRKVDEFLEGADRGYLVIEAEAGLGKSTFLAWLARERGYVHHFCELTPGASGVGPALANLATQVASQCGLDEFEAEAMTSGATARPDAFYSLLERAATRRGGPLVLVVDALDEAGTPPRQNVLGLPHILPKGVFFVASQRPVPVSLWTDLATTPHIPLEIAAQSDDNLRDMREYLRKVADWAGVATERRKAGVGADEFIGALAQKCQGVWIYLHYVVHEIDGGKRSPLDLKNLPDGMTDYYVRHWRAWHDDDPPRWYATDLPLLATLAAGREALPLGRLLAWSGAAADPERVRSLLEESWRPFLLVSNEGSGVRATVYHATLREFLDGRASRARLTKAEAAFLNRMAQETVRAHGRIADHLLGAFGGLDEGLPRLKDEGGRGEEARYGLRHLAEHLEAAGRADDLHRLLRVGWPAAASQGHPENAWFAARDRLGDALGFLTDVTRAWQLAEDQFEESRDPALLGLQARYALLTTSHRTRVGLTDPRWLLKYVEAGFWPLEKALAHARQIPNPSRRAKALRLLAASPGAERGAVLDEALAAAANVVGPRKRLNTLISLIPFLASPARRRAERMALSATLSLYDEENENQFFNAMLRLLGLLHGPNLSLALQAIQGTDEYQYGSKDFVRRAMVSTPGASTSAALRRIAQAIEVFEAFLRAIGDPPYYHVGFLVVCLAAQAPRMPRPRFRRLARVLVRRQLLWRVVNRYIGMSDDTLGKSGASIPLILCLRERIFGGERMFREYFFAVLRWMHPTISFSLVIRRTAHLLPGAILPDLIKLIRTYNPYECPHVIESHHKAMMLDVLAPRLPQDLLVGGAVPIAELLSLGYREFALDVLNAHIPMPQCLPHVTAHFRSSELINDQLRAAVTMTHLSLGLPEPGRTRAVNTAWALFLSNPSEDNVATALSVMAPRLTHPLLSEAVTFAFQLPYRTVDAIRALAPHLPAPLLADAWATAKRWKPPWDLTEHKAKVLMALIPCFSDDARTKCLSYTLRITRTIYNEFERAILLARLAFVYPRARRDALLRESVKAASSISSEFPHMIIRFLRLVGPRLPSRLLREALRMTDGWSPRKRQGIRRMVAERREVLREMKSAGARATSTIPLSCNGQISSQDDGPAVGEKITAALAAPDHERARALEALVPLLAGVHDNYAWIIWREWLRAAATGTRARLLAGLGRIMPLPLRLGGAEALAELAGAIEDVIHWIP